MHGPNNFDSGNRCLRNINLEMTTVTSSHPINISLCFHFFIFSISILFLLSSRRFNQFFLTNLSLLFSCVLQFFYVFPWFLFLLFYSVFSFFSMFSQCFLISFLNLNFSTFLHLISFFFQITWNSLSFITSGISRFLLLNSLPFLS